MSSNFKKTKPAKPALATRVDELRMALQQVPVDLLAESTATSYQSIDQGRGEFRLSLFGSPVVITFPGFVGVDQNDEVLPLPYQAAIVYYFYTSDGTLLTGEWISFAELPDGRMYNRAFQGYSGDELVKVFGLDVEAFKRTCEYSGGIPTSLGDAAYIFHSLPRVPMVVNYWLGDESFPSSCKILFDRSADHYLPTDVCAILGGMLTRKLIKNAS